MSLFMEIETDRKLPFDARKIAELVIETSLVTFETFHRPLVTVT